MIVIDASPLQTGHRFRGIGTYTASLLDGLTSLPHTMPLGLLMEQVRSSDMPLLTDLTARPNVHRMSMHKLPWRRDRLQWLISRLAIIPTLGCAQAHLYHATDPNGLVRLPGITTIATLYDLIPLHYPAAHFPLRWFDQRVGYALYLHLLRRAHHLIAISEATKNDAVERLRIPPQRISVIPLAVDERHFYPRDAPDITRTLARYNMHRPYFLHVGSYVGIADHNKNTMAVIQAFQLFCQAGSSDHALYLAGKWSPRALADLQTSYPELIATGRLRPLGFVPDEDLPALYGGADAFVFPSLIEGFGLPVLEAMRCATPVLTSNLSSLPEAGGDAALYVDPHRTEDIAAALDRLASDPHLRADLRARGLQRAQMFSWSRTAAATLRVYQRFS